VEWIMEKATEIIEQTEKANSLTKNIWLAGLGAYSTAFNKTQGLEKVSQKSTRLFDELVAKGKRIEGDIQEKRNEIKDKSSTAVEEHLAQLKESLNFTTKNSALENQLEEVTTKLDQIINALGTKKTEKKVPVSAKAA